MQRRITQTPRITLNNQNNQIYLKRWCLFHALFFSDAWEDGRCKEKVFFLNQKFQNAYGNAHIIMAS